MGEVAKDKGGSFDVPFVRGDASPLFTLNTRYVAQFHNPPFQDNKIENYVDDREGIKIFNSFKKIRNARL